MSAIDALIADLEGEGTVESRGGFTLDRAKAREKMRQFQLADPREYLLHLVRAASLMGAQRISIDIDADDMHLRFDGQTFATTDFEELYDALFGRADDQSVAARRHLALGLNAALGLDPRRIEVRSGSARLRVAPGVDDDFGVLDPPIEGTWIHARDRLRLGNLVRFFKNMADGLPEAALVRARCGFCPIELVVNGAPVPSGFDGLAQQTQGFNRQTADGFDVGGGLTTPDAPGRVHLIVGGVQITTMERPDMPGLLAAATGPGLRTDVSQANVVRGEAFDALLVRIEQVRLEALTRTADPAFLDAELATADWSTLSDRYGLVLAHALRARPAGQTLDGRVLTVGQVRAPVPVLRSDLAERRLALDIDPPAPFASMLVLTDTVPDWLRKNLTNQTAAWSEHLRCLEGKRDFERRAAAPTLDPAAFRTRDVIADGPWRGEIGLLEVGPQYGRVRWVLNGRLLAEQPFGAPVPGVMVALEGPITPRADFGGVQVDDRLRPAAQVIARHIHALLQALPPGDENDGLVLRWIRAGDEGDPVGQIVAAMTEQRRTIDKGWLRRLPHASDAVATRPLFRATGGARLGLSDLAALAPFDVVGEDTEGPAVEPPIVQVSSRDKTLLQQIFGAQAIRSGTQRLKHARKRARFEALPPRAPDLRFVTARVVAEAAFEHGMVGLCQQSNAGGRVQPFVGGRPVKTLSVRLPLPGLVAAIEVGELPLNASFTALREPPVDLIMRRLVPPLDRLFDDAPQGPARRVWRALIDLIFPTPTWAATWARLSPDAYRNALRGAWRSKKADWERLATARIYEGQPSDPINDPLLEGFFAAEGDVADRLRAAWPTLCRAPLFRCLDRDAASFEAIATAIEQDGLVLHATRPSAVPDAFGGLALRTEHAQLERLALCFGEESFERATAWGAEHAMQAALAAAPVDPGGLPAGTVGQTAIPGGQVGFAMPFDHHAATRIEVVVKERIVATLSPRLRLPLLGYVHADDDTRVVLRGGRLAIDDLARVRIESDAREAIESALEAVAEMTNPPADIVRAALTQRAQGRRSRSGLTRDPLTARLAEMSILPRLGAAPACLLDVVDRRRRREPIWVTTDPSTALADANDWVLLLDETQWAWLNGLLKTPQPDYAKAIEADQREAAFLSRPSHPGTLADAQVAVPIEDGELRGWIGWGAGDDVLTVLRAGRRLGTTRLRLGFTQISGIIDDPQAPHTDGWDGVRETPRVRRLRRVVASGIPALAQALADQHPAGARILAWSLLRAAVPNPTWMELFDWLHADRDARLAISTWRDALRAAYQHAPRVLRAELPGVPVSIDALMTHGRPTGGGADGLVRAAFGGAWPLSGSGDALARLVQQLGPLADISLFDDDGGPSLQALCDAPTTAMDDLPKLPASDRDLLEALLGSRSAERQAEARQRAEHAEAERTARIAAQAAAEARRARLRQREIEARARAAAEQRAADEAARQAAEEAARREQAAHAQRAREAEARRALAAQKPAPDEALLDRVRQILERLKARHPRLLADVNLARMQLVETGPLAVADEAGVRIARDHPAVIAALAGTPIADAIVASAIYTALNLWLEDITDAHEVRFVGWMGQAG